MGGVGRAAAAGAGRGTRDGGGGEGLGRRSMRGDGVARCESDRVRDRRFAVCMYSVYVFEMFVEFDRDRKKSI